MIFDPLAVLIFNPLNVSFYSGLESSKNLSSSAPGAISDEVPQHKPMSVASFNSSFDSGAGKARISKDSAMEDENCRSLSAFTDSTEQSAAINFDMSNRVSGIFFLNYLTAAVDS